MTERAARGGQKREATAQRHRLFIANYLSNGNNALRAAIAAGYSEKTAGQAGHKLMQIPEIIKAIAAEAERVAKKAGVTAERTLEILGHVNESDLRRYFRPDGSMMAPSEWDADMAAAVASFEAIPVLLSRATARKPAVIGYNYKLKFWDKNAGVDKAMKHLGLFEKDNAQGRESLVLHVQAATPVKK